MMTWLAENALATALSIFGSFLAGFISRKVGHILDAIEKKAKIDIDDKLEVRIQNIVKKVVLTISQTYVKGLKKKGQFDDAAKKAALDMALKRSSEIILNEVGVKKSADDLKVAIEAEIREQKDVKNIVRSINESKGSSSSQ